MTNLEWLEKVKRSDGVFKLESNDMQRRQVKALEIIAEETINTKIDILEELKNIKVELSVIANKRGV